MNHRSKTVVFLLLTTISLAASGIGQPAASPKDKLSEAFQNPPSEARASCYWWWKGDLSADEMERQLHLLKEAGLGGAHIIPWESQPAYLTPEWLRILRVAADAAHKEGMILDLSANAKWPFRGTWVPETESLQKVQVETFHVQGPRKFTLPAPTARKNKRNANGVANEAASSILLAQLAPDPVSRVDQMRDVTDALTAADSPGVDVPSGNYTVHVVRLSSNVKSSAEFGRVPDHFNPQAMENYLKGFGDRVAPALGGKLSNGLRAMYCDSIELSEANWTPNLREEFKRRNGYDLMPYLPMVLNIDARDRPPINGHTPLDVIITRVRYDYCRTLVDLFLDGMARPFYRWCHENGVLCRWQAYGWPWFYGIEDGYRIPDMPEGNNWLFVPDAFHHDVDMMGYPLWQKLASSGAHQAGRRVVSVEAMTVVQGKFQETLDLIKRADDFNFVSGINYSFLHGFCYSPANEPFPGRNQYGTYFSEQNPWWTYMRRWMDYNARLSSVFQSSKPVAQVGLLARTSDIWGQAGLHRHPYQMSPPWAHQVWRWINQNGANADYLSDAVLQQASFSEGKINFGPMRYDALVVLGAQSLVPGTAQALERYARAGGRIVFVGAIPDSSPGLQNAIANDAKVREVVQKLLHNYSKSVIRRAAPGAVPSEAQVEWLESMNQWRKSTSPGQCLKWADQLLTDLGIQRSIQFEEPSVGLYQIHYRQDDGRNLYFFANTAQSDIAATAVFPDAGRHIERWDPETGTRSPFALDQKGRALVALPAGGSLLLVASPGKEWGSTPSELTVKPSAKQKITGPWSVEFKPANHALAPFEIASFQLGGLDQSKEERLNRFSGEALYRTRFTWSASVGDTVHVDLGAVPNCVTEVNLNGRPLGARWYGRHDYIVGGALKPGENQLEVKVVTTLFNCQRKIDEKAIPSGLVGPVMLWTATANNP